MWLENPDTNTSTCPGRAVADTIFFIKYEGPQVPLWGFLRQHVTGLFQGHPAFLFLVPNYRFIILFVTMDIIMTDGA